ncbi:MAG: LCP family protein [Acidimicrobiales bacterium]
MAPTDPPTPRRSRPSGQASSAPTGRPRAGSPDSSTGPSPRRPDFPGPILGGQVAVPTRRERRKARKRRRRPSERILRGVIAVVVVLLLITGLGYGYFRYQWSKVASSPCDTCVAAANGQPYNVLLIGSDSRAGETAAEAQQFGSATTAGGQRSDTIKIVHVDPEAGTASSLSIPRDTYVTLSGMAANSQLSSSNKINAAFANGPDALIQTIQNTFGIPISHYIEISFFGLQDAINALGGISMDFPYPVRDRNLDTGVNESGLDISQTGCQLLNGSQALSLSRSRYFEYYADGQWSQDPSSDIGRIQRQNLIISAAIDKAKSTYNPLRLNALLTSVVHDFSKDDGLTPGDLFGLAERYHAFSGSQLQAYTLPTSPAHSSAAGDVEVVQPDRASPVLAGFLGGTAGTITTPPQNAYGQPHSLTVAPTTTTGTSSPAAQAPSGGPPTTAPATPSIPAYDPRPC